MKKTVLLFVAAFALSSCKKESSPEAAASPDQMTEAEAAEVYAASAGETLSAGTLSKYTDAKTLETKGPGDLAVLETPEVAGCVYPTRIVQLGSGTELKLYKFDKNMSASASAMGFSGEIGKKQMLFIQDYIRYGMVDCKGVKKKVGIGLRCYIHVTSFKGKVGYTQLPGIAANVELGNAECSFELKSLGFGIDGSVLAEGLNPQGEYNVENFAKVSATFSNVLKLLNNNSAMEIHPVDLP